MVLLRIFEPQGSRRYKGIFARYFVDSLASDGCVGSAPTCHTLQIEQLEQLSKKSLGGAAKSPP